jgi:Cyclic nucleotide-binding domain/Major Facilitator Superfamily
MRGLTAWLTSIVAGYSAVLRSRNLRRAQLAWAGAVTAEWAFFVGVGVFAFEQGGTLAVGLVGLIRMLPSAFVGPFASALGDRYRRDRVVLGLFVSMAAAIAVAALVAYTSPSAVVIYVLAAIAAAAATLSRSAQWALLPSLCGTPEELVAANGATMTTENVGALAGPALGGLLLAVASPGALFAACAGIYLLSAVLVFYISAEEEGPARRRGEPLREQLLGGFRALARERGAAFVIGLFCCQALIRGALNVFLVVIPLRLLDTGEGGVGLLTAALGAGGLVGAFASLSIAGRRLALPFAAGMLLWGLPLVVVGASPGLGAALLMVAVIGAGNSILDVAGITLLQRLVPNEVLARVLGVMWGLALLAMGIGSIAVAGLIAAVGMRAALVVTGAFLPVATALGWRRLRAIDRSATVPADQLAALDCVPMLAHLSLVAKEEIASALLPVEREAGAEVIRQGEGGDYFYILLEGEADVIRDSATVVTRSAPDYFGEIALLRDVPRTATVRARSPVRLYALDREHFIAAVTRHAAGREAGQTVVAKRMAERSEPTFG